MAGVELPPAGVGLLDEGVLEGFEGAVVVELPDDGVVAEVLDWPEEGVLDGLEAPEESGVGVVVPEAGVLEGVVWDPPVDGVVAELVAGVLVELDGVGELVEVPGLLEDAVLAWLEVGAELPASVGAVPLVGVELVGAGLLEV